VVESLVTTVKLSVPTYVTEPKAAGGPRSSVGRILWVRFAFDALVAALAMALVPTVKPSAVPAVDAIFKPFRFFLFWLPSIGEIRFSC
jgi:hypothetical protein